MVRLNTPIFQCAIATRSSHHWRSGVGLMFGLMLLGMAVSAQATIRSTERTALINLYNSTNGNNWSDRTGWNGPVGSECSWYGVVCDASQTHVIAVALRNNHLTGRLSSFTQVYSGYLVLGLTSLQGFDVSYNELTGSIPDLGWVGQMQYFSVDHNHLTGSIPASLSSLGNLRNFYAQANQLTGDIPPLDWLSDLTEFNVSYNWLSGPLPELAGLANLQSFKANNNWDISGSIPSLAGLSRLVVFDVQHASLTGPIPSLDDLVELEYFDVNDNWLTGSIPSINGSHYLWHFVVSRNELTGSIPSLDGLRGLQTFQVGYNQLTGLPPAPPPSLSLAVGGLWQLCPNRLTRVKSPAWDSATGTTPWYSRCW